ncbi:unnamed protein product [Effrenium voratum]|uniref:Uncharacterized protein n=1 Tax=Effrenium voratum TaxID=2562239 RepID=A0AA36IZE1_9DINO|nr:unnamed protein product [Effrenium voratum]CAJ1456079.1 unnamed protein product [Effrenium voratum]
MTDMSMPTVNPAATAEASVPPWSLPIAPTEQCCCCLPMIGGARIWGVLCAVSAILYIGLVLLALQQHGTLFLVGYLAVIVVLQLVKALGLLQASRGSPRWARLAAFACVTGLGLQFLGALVGATGMVTFLIGAAVDCYFIYVILSLEQFVFKNQAQARTLNV